MAAHGERCCGSGAIVMPAAAPIFKFTFHKQSARADRLPFRSSEQAKYKTANPISRAINPLKNDASVAQLRAVFDSEMKLTERSLARTTNKHKRCSLVASFCRSERMKQNEKKKQGKLCVCNFLWKCCAHTQKWSRNNWGVRELLFMADANKMRKRKNKLQTCRQILCLVCSWEPFNYSRCVHSQN